MGISNDGLSCGTADAPTRETSALALTSVCHRKKYVSMMLLCIICPGSNPLFCILAVSCMVQCRGMSKLSSFDLLISLTIAESSRLSSQRRTKYIQESLWAPRYHGLLAHSLHAANMCIFDGTMSTIYCTRCEPLRSGYHSWQAPPRIHKPRALEEH